MPEPIRRTNTPQTTQDEIARMKREQQRLSEAQDAEEALRVLLIDVARQIAQARRRYMASVHPRWEEYEVTRISIKLASGDLIVYRVHPGWNPEKPTEPQTEEKKPDAPK